MIVKRRGSLLLGLAICLLLIAVLTATAPAEDDVATDYRDVVVGRSAATRQFDVRVTDVRVGRQLINTYDQRVRTRAAFVVISLTAQTPDGSASYDDLLLETSDGHRYKPRSDFIDSELQATEPGFRTRGNLVFELPADRLPEAELIIGPDGQSFTYYTIKVRVDLGLTRSTPYASRPIRLRASTYEVIG